MKLTSSKSWPDLCQERYLWAEKSYTAFLHQFDEARFIQTDNRTSRQVSVIVYGPAQVGKTSFILTLLGVRDTHFTTLNTLLRGGQTLGNMSTARSYRYRIAEDNGWYFSHIDNGQKKLDSKDVVEVFASLRQEMEQGRRVYDSIDVFIPRHFFDPEDQASHHLLIRDLPGTHSTNKNEQHYVNDLASRYLSSADVVLLMGRVDGLYFLKQDELGNALLNNWHWQQHRYKIVLTRAYSDASLRRMLEKSALGKAELQKYLLGQINTMELMLRDSISQLIYPVECGHSWQAIMAEDNHYSAQCRVLRREIMTDLTLSLHQSANPLSRLRTGYALPQIIEQQIAAEHETYDIELLGLQRQLQRNETLHLRYLALDNQNNSDSEKLTTQRNEWQEMLTQGFTDSLYQDFEQRIGQMKEVETLDYLKEIISDFTLYCSSVWRDGCIHHQLPTCAVPDSEQVRAVEKHLMAYWFDTYVFSSTFREDLYSLLRACRADAGHFQERASALLNAKKEIKINELEKKQRRCQHRSRRISRIIKMLEKKNAALQLEKRRLTQNHDEQISLYTNQLGKSKEFRNVILDAKNKRTLEIKTRISDPKINNSERLAWLMMQRMLNNDFEFVKSLGDGND